MPNARDVLEQVLYFADMQNTIPIKKWHGHENGIFDRLPQECRKPLEVAKLGTLVY